MPNATLQTLLDRRAGFLAFVQHRVHDRALAEDILQAAFVRALEHAGTLREENSAVAWFYSVLRHAVIDHHRHHTSEASAIDRWAAEMGLTGPNAAEPSTAGIPARTFICGCIEQVLPTLRPAYAEVLREVDLAEKPLADYAKTHHLTPGNAAVRAHRARAALRRELARTCGACSIHACLDCVCKAQPRIEEGTC
jgi:RNA polymerase sigma factor (sigma-70 family)